MGRTAGPSGRADRSLSDATSGRQNLGGPSTHDRRRLPRARAGLARMLAHAARHALLDLEHGPRRRSGGCAHALGRLLRADPRLRPPRISRSAVARHAERGSAPRTSHARERARSRLAATTSSRRTNAWCSPVAAGHAARTRQHAGTLTRAKLGALRLLVRRSDRQVQAQVRDERKRVAGSNASGVSTGQTSLLEVRARAPLRSDVDLPSGSRSGCRARRAGRQIARASSGPASPATSCRRLADRASCSPRVRPSGGSLVVIDASSCSWSAGDADHEELVEVGVATIARNFTRSSSGRTSGPGPLRGHAG